MQALRPLCGGESGESPPAWCMRDDECRGIARRSRTSLSARELCSTAMVRSTRGVTRDLRPLALPLEKDPKWRSSRSMP